MTKTITFTDDQYALLKDVLNFYLVICQESFSEYNDLDRPEDISKNFKQIQNLNGLVQ